MAAPAKLNSHSSVRIPACVICDSTDIHHTVREAPASDYTFGGWECGCCGTFSPDEDAVIYINAPVCQ